MMDTCGINVIFFSRKVDAPVWRCHHLSHCILDEDICPLFTDDRVIEVLVNGVSTVS